MATTTKKIEIDQKLLETISKIAKDENATEQEIMTKIIKKGIENIQNKNKIPEHLLMNKDTYDPDPKRTEELIGIIELNEPFDSKKAIREIRGIE